MRMRASQSIVCILLITASANAQTVWYVDDDGDTENGCTSWEDACPDLQTALGLATTGEQIWVAIGTYKPDVGSGDRFGSFQLISGVALYGGFDGTEQTFDERAELFDQTILSGDLNGDDLPGFINTAENSLQVLTGSGTDSTALLDGFTISGGNADGVSIYRAGGGMYNDGGSPTIANCTFRDNQAESNGGAVYNRIESHARIKDCKFTGNTSFSGGAINNYQSNVVITRCLFHANSASSGGAISNGGSSAVLISHSNFIGNSSTTVQARSRTTTTVSRPI